MKKVISLGIALLAIGLGSIAQAIPVSQPSNDDVLYAFNNPQIVNAVTPRGGQWVMVKLRIQNGQLWGFSFGGRDYRGEIDWQPCIPTRYRETNMTDGSDICREFSYTATVSGQGFRSFQVYW